MPEHIPPYSKHSAMTDVNVPVKELEGTVPLNKVGFYVSKLANAYEHSRNLIFSDYPDVPGYNTETEALAEKLGDGREVTALGVENLENAAARLYYDNGTSKLVESTDIYEKAAAIAQKHGLKGKQAIDEVIKSFEKHELVHNSDHRKGLSEEQKEIYVGELLAEFFSDRAEIVDEKLARIYRKLAEENEDYAEGHRNGTLMSKIEYFSRKYAEARARGMDEDKAIKYATKSVEELEKSELEETVENEEIGEAREDAAKAEKNKEYSERKISADEDAQEQEAGQETTDDTATKEG
jgi:hypothetical protein